MNAPITRMHTFQLAEHFGVTLEQMVGPEQARFHARNVAQSRLLEIMEDLPEDAQEAVAVLAAGVAHGLITTVEVEALAAGTPEQLTARIVAWRDALTPVQRALLDTLPVRA